MVKEKSGKSKAVDEKNAEEEKAEDNLEDVENDLQQVKPDELLDENEVIVKKPEPAEGEAVDDAAVEELLQKKEKPAEEK